MRVIVVGHVLDGVINNGRIIAFGHMIILVMLIIYFAFVIIYQSLFFKRGFAILIGGFAILIGGIAILIGRITFLEWYIILVIVISRFI